MASTAPHCETDWAYRSLTRCGPTFRLRTHLDRGYGLVKNNRLAQAVEAVAGNVRVGTRPIQMYEWTRTFHPNAEADNGVCDEVHRLWAIADGNVEPDRWLGKPRAADAWMLKGLVEEIATALRVPLEVSAADAGHPLSDCMHPPPSRHHPKRGDGGYPGRGSSPHHQGLQAQARSPGIPGDHAVGPARSGRDPPLPRALSTPTHHARARVLAAEWYVTAGEVADTLTAAGPEWLERVDIVDAFAHDDDGAPMRAITFSLRYGNREGDRSAEAVNVASSGLIDAVLANYGDRGVTLRASQ